MFVWEVEDVEVDTWVKSIKWNCFHVTWNCFEKLLHHGTHLASSTSMTVGGCVWLERLIILAFRRWQEVLWGKTLLTQDFNKEIHVIYLEPGVGWGKIVDSMKGQVSRRLWKKRQRKRRFSWVMWYISSGWRGDCSYMKGSGGLKEENYSFRGKAYQKA